MRRRLAPLGLVLLAATAAASTVVKLGLEDLVTGAEVIVEGQVVRIAAHLDRKGGIATTYSLAVDRAFKGASPGVPFEVTLPGGVLGARGMIVPGVPVLELGEEVVLFLTAETSRGIRLPVGLGQGRFLLRRDPTTGARKVRQALGNLRRVDPRSGAPVAPGPPWTMDYDAFAAEVERLVAQGRR